MEKKRGRKRRALKQIGVVLLFLVINLALVSLLSKIYYEFNSGADRSKLLHINLEYNSYYKPKIKVTADNVEGRQPNLQNVNTIKQDYLKSWYVRKYALLNNDPKAIEDFYTDSAQVKIQRIIAQNSLDTVSVGSTSSEHDLTIKFFSEDGQVVYVDDNNVKEHHYFFKKGKFLHKNQTLKDYSAILLLEDGFWRIRHLVSEQSKHRMTTKSKALVTKTPIKGINYYPQKTPWFEFWKQYDSTVVKKDFEIIKNLKLNTVRIFIPYELFGKEYVYDSKLKLLQKTLDIAQETGLKVIVTFFDFYSNYQILDYTICDRHLEKIVNGIKSHPALLQYDIKNEPDLDILLYGEAKVTNWLSFMIQRLRSYDPNTPITIGWATPEKAHLLADEVDVVSFHFYKKIKNFNEDIKKLRTQTDKPLVVQEFGRHSKSSIWNFWSHNKNKQAKYHKKMQTLFKENNIQNFVSWTLYDFPEIDPAIFGRMPHKIGPQKNFGFIDIEGNLKPAAKYIASDKD